MYRTLFIVYGAYVVLVVLNSFLYFSSSFYILLFSQAIFYFTKSTGEKYEENHQLEDFQQMICYLFF